MDRKKYFPLNNFKELKSLFSLAIAKISIFFILQKEKNFFLIIPLLLSKVAIFKMFVSSLIEINNS